MQLPITVLPVRGKALQRAFIGLPHALYRSDPLWIPPLHSDMQRRMSAQQNPFFAEADIEHFVAQDASGVTRGRICTSIHHAYNRRFGPEHAFFGLFEAEDQPEVASALFTAAESWARLRGRSCITGPYSYTASQDAALLIDNIDGQPPTVLQTYNPPHYRRLLEQSGYAMAFSFSTYGGAMHCLTRSQRSRTAGARVRARHKISVRSATRADLRSNLDEIRRLFNDSFYNNQEVVDLSAPVFRFAIDSVRPFIDLEGIRVIEVDRRPSAFFLILPDLNPLLKRLQGRVGLLDYFRLPAYRRHIKDGVIALIGSNTASQGQGLGRVIAEEIHRYASTRFESLHTMWIDDRNPFSYMLAENWGLARTKRFGVFRKTLPSPFDSPSLPAPASADQPFTIKPR